MLFCVLQRASHSIKTIYGASKPVHGDKDELIAEIGQRNGLGPSLWCLVCTILIKMCRMKRHSIAIITAISRMLVSLIELAFVDNADLVTTDNDAHMSGETMIKRM